MEINLLILGCLFILTLFGVGESVLKFFHLNKIFVLISLALLISGLFAPNLNIDKFSVNIGYVLLPAIFSIIMLFKLKKPSKFLVAFFLVVLLTLAYSLIPMDEVLMLSYIPTLFFGLINGILLALLSNNFSTCAISCFIGMNVGDMVFHLTRFENFSLLGNEFIFTSALIGIITFLIISFVLYKIGYYNKKVKIIAQTQSV